MESMWTRCKSAENRNGSFHKGSLTLKPPQLRGMEITLSTEVKDFNVILDGNLN